MLKGFKYNQECRKMRDRSVYAEEHKILSDFLATDNENVRLEYGDEREAFNAAMSHRKWTRDIRKPLKITQRKNFVFAFKTIED